MLITSISGIRGTIGGAAGDGLTPHDIVRFAAGYASWLRTSSGLDRPLVVVGRDARLSGEMVRDVLVGSLNAMGVDVLDLGLSTTPTLFWWLVGLAQSVLHSHRIGCCDWLCITWRNMAYLQN